MGDVKIAAIYLHVSTERQDKCSLESHREGECLYFSLHAVYLFAFHQYELFTKMKRAQRMAQKESVNANIKVSHLAVKRS